MTFPIPTLEQHLEALQNKGLTLTRHGDTFKPSEGYLVAVQNIITAWHSLDDILAELPFHNWPKSYTDEYLGFWQNETGYWWADISVHVLDKDEALKIADENFEAAIWDCENNCAILLGV